MCIRDSSADRVRKFRVFAPRTYVSVDLAAREARVFRLLGGDAAEPEIDMEVSPASQEEPLRLQLASFVAACQSGARPVVSGEDGRRALALARTILDRMSDTNPPL